MTPRTGCALRLSVRTQDFHSCKRGSTPLGRATFHLFTFMRKSFQRAFLRAYQGGFMRITKSTVVVAVAVLGLAGASGVAFASHGKAGLWTVDMSIAGQDTSKMPPNVLDRMKSMGMVPNGSGGFTVQHCMTADEVADDSKMMDTSNNRDCQVANRQISGHSMTADLVCKGQMTGSGHVSVNY